MSSLVYNGAKVNNQGQMITEDKLNSILFSFISSFVDIEVQFPVDNWVLNPNTKYYENNVFVKNVNATKFPIWGVVGATDEMTSEEEINATYIMDVSVSDEHVFAYATTKPNAVVRVMVKSALMDSQDLVNQIITDIVRFGDEEVEVDITKAVRRSVLDGDGTFVAPYTKFTAVYNDAGDTLEEIINSITSYVTKDQYTGTASKAIKLQTGREISVTIGGSTVGVTFDGTSAVDIDLSSIKMPISNGGTGGSTIVEARTNLLTPGVKSIQGNTYYGLTTPDGVDSNWLRTPEPGILPYITGDISSAHSSIGTSGWYFNTAYIKTIYGSLSGNASTADKLSTPRKIAISGSVSGNANFDGSGNINIETTTNHTHEYLPLSGGTLLGNLDIGNYDTNEDRIIHLLNKSTNDVKHQGTVALYKSGDIRIGNYNATTSEWIGYVDFMGANDDSYGNIHVKPKNAVYVDSNLWMNDGKNYFYCSKIMAAGATTNSEIDLGTNIDFYHSDGGHVCFVPGQFRPSSESKGDITLGSSSNRWGQIYSTKSSISTSDRNLKKNIKYFDKDLKNLDAYENLFFALKPATYMFKDTSSDRTHNGFISQDVEESLSTVGLTPYDFAAFCKDIVTEDIYEDAKDKDGNVIVNPKTQQVQKEFVGTKEVFDDEGNPTYSYSLRYEEFIALNTHMIQKIYDEFNSYKEETSKAIKSLQDEIKLLKEDKTNG